MVSDLEIRLASPPDAGAISEVLKEAFAVFEGDYTPEAFAVVTPPADEIRSRFDEGPMWVAVIGGDVIGTVSAQPDVGRLYIRSMAVMSAAQGLGVGGRLLDAIDEFAIDNGFDEMYLYTTYFSPAAIRLYEHHGFVHTRDTTAEEWFGTPGLEMEKKTVKDQKIDVIRS